MYNIDGCHVIFFFYNYFCLYISSMNIDVYFSTVVIFFLYGF